MPEFIDVANGRHSYIRFYPSDWMAGVARLPRMHRSVYFDVCCYIWDTAKPCPPIEIMMMLSDVPDASTIIDNLIELGKLERLPDGSISNARALAEAEKAVASWQAQVGAGKATAERRAARQAGRLADSLAGSLAEGGLLQEPEPEPEPENPKGFIYVGPDEIVEAWNAMARPVKLPCISRITESRRSHLKARLAEHGGQTILDAIAKVPQSDFLMGSTGWKANLDSMIRPDNMAKLIEGAYHGRSSGKQSGWLG